MKESVIVYEHGEFWVYAGEDRYTVYRVGVTHSTADSAYPKDPDGLSLAKARVEYLWKYRSSR